MNEDEGEGEFEHTVSMSGIDKNSVTIIIDKLMKDQGWLRACAYDHKCTTSMHHPHTFSQIQKEIWAWGWGEAYLTTSIFKVLCILISCNLCIPNLGTVLSVDITDAWCEHCTCNV